MLQARSLILFLHSLTEIVPKNTSPHPMIPLTRLKDLFCGHFSDSAAYDCNLQR